MPPANDDWASATAIAGAAGTAAGTNVDATLQAGESDEGYGHNSVWWAWTAPFTGTAVVDTGGSDFDTYLSVWTGASLAGLVLEAANNDAGPAIDDVQS